MCHDRLIVLSIPAVKLHTLRAEFEGVYVSLRARTPSQLVCLQVSIVRWAYEIVANWRKLVDWLLQKNLIRQRKECVAKLVEVVELLRRFKVLTLLKQEEVFKVLVSHESALVWVVEEIILPSAIFMIERQQFIFTIVFHDQFVQLRFLNLVILLIALKELDHFTLA